MKILKCLVLLSTYNGEMYVEEQLKSLLKQEGIELHILIRDDGSKDSTVSVIDHFSDLFSDKLRLIKSFNLGAKSSFFELIRIAADEYSQYDYYAFCDQDDVWMPGKSLRAVNMLRRYNQSSPLMYCSSTQMVDAELSPLKVWPSPPRKKLCMYNALVENVAVGCTTVLNKNAFDLIASSLPSNSDQVIMHDWWAYLCVSTFGKVLFDEEPFILYRQHSSNVLGGQTDNWNTKWKKRFLRYFRGQNHYIISNQAKEFYNCFNDQMDDIKRLDVQRFIEATSKPWGSRSAYTLHTPFYRQVAVDNYIFKLIFSTGKI
ncbi:glycosyltransferase family 2 protein [Paenibacillus sp. FSL R5-0407]|uniref:glycosyltransferase family 2 protein n=1 Tax=Paenibacillus sp. FSL R5-0407 TaxID=2975320 RepID=UPI0030F785AC